MQWKGPPQGRCEKRGEERLVYFVPICSRNTLVCRHYHYYYYYYYYKFYIIIIGGRGSSVGIATRYWIDGPGINSRWRQDFLHLSRPAPGAYPASCITGTGSFSWTSFFFSFGVLHLMLPEAPHSYGLLYYPTYWTFQLSPPVPRCHAP
jgi:hypothetical protein